MNLALHIAALTQVRMRGSLGRAFYDREEDHRGATLTSSAAGLTPTTSSSDKQLPGPAEPEPTTSDPAA